MLRLGIIGCSNGNGHPYSWSAIFNGYNMDFMKACPYPSIPFYLGKEVFPDNFLGHLGRVTHIWTQDRLQSQHIANSALIDYIADSPEAMIGYVDAILLARDDAENHFKLSEPFLNAGLPVFIDKPLAYSIGEASKILALAKYPNQIFTCSSLRYAKEFDIDNLENEIGEIKFLEGIVPKNWNNYSIHVIDPSLGLLKKRGKLLSVSKVGNAPVQVVNVQWENKSALFKSTGSIASPIAIRVYGELGIKDLVFDDSFHAFKKSLENFVAVIQNEIVNIPVAETLEIIEIIEGGT